MITPLAIGEPIKYVVKAEKEDKSPTVWIIGTLDSFQQAKITSLLFTVDIKEGEPVVKKNTAEYGHTDFMIVKYGLKGFENFGTLKFRTEKVKLFDKELDLIPDDILKHIPLNIIHELSDVIWGENQVSEKLRKN